MANDEGVLIHAVCKPSTTCAWGSLRLQSVTPHSDFISKANTDIVSTG